MVDEGKVELLLLHIKRSPRWFEHQIMFPLDTYLWRFSRRVFLEGGPGTDPELSGGIESSLGCEHLWITQVSVRVSILHLLPL